MDDESSKSYVEPVSKVKFFDSVSKKVNVEPAAEQEVIDDFGSGPYEDEPLLNETSSVQCSGRKLTFSWKVKQSCTTSIRKNSGHNDLTLSKSVPNILQKLGKLSFKFTTKNKKMKRFSMKELECATRNFRSDLKLDSGCFGEAFIGWLDEDMYSPSVLDVGLVVVIKKVYQPLKVDKTEWMLEILQQFRDPHFVKLIGYCLDNEVLLLVSEFMQSGSIHDYLITGAESLPWGTRVKMALGVAQGLVFLYKTFGENIHPKIVNVKNIMLDKDFNAKFSDFEVAKIVRGSIYINESGDPLYFHVSKLKELDNRFRDILLEILFQESARSREWKEKMCLLRSSGKFSVADPRLKQEGALDCDTQLAKALLYCRPISRKEVVSALEIVYAWMEKHKNS